MDVETDLRNEIKRLEMALARVTKERDSYIFQLEKLRYKIKQMAVPPLLVATVSREVDDTFMIVKTPNGQEFLVPSPFEGLKPGDSVGLNQQTLAIVKILPSNVDQFVAGMELDEKPKETYEDIGGLVENIKLVREVVELPLTNPGIFEKMGIEAPGGVLLEGPPGTGKTLLARAVANASKATFIRLVGSELVQKYIGEGARLVRELFSLAREKAPVVVFIDEIDAIASKRTPDSQVSDREVQRTLMQLLAEMDGFKPNDGVKILAATNRPDILDPAIMRPGRFDRIISFKLPEAKGREEILKIHSRKMPLDSKLNMKLLGAMTENMSGADLKAICTEAGMNAIRAEREVVTEADFIMAIQKMKQKSVECAITAPVYS
jgi:proteasome regulatory subunit